MEDLSITITDSKVLCESGFLEYSLDYSSKLAIVCSINVYRKRLGIGTVLLQTFEEMPLEEKIDTISVPVSLSSEAICFWLSLGYETTNKYDKRKINKILMSDNYY